jgi:hypothetical protein
VRILELTWNDCAVPFEKRKVLWVNGKIAKPATLIFPTDDPNIYISTEELEHLSENKLYVRLEVVRLSPEMAQDMANAVKKIL